MYRFPSRKYIGTYNKINIFRVLKKCKSLFIAAFPSVP
jgi:hypothetical protein